MFIINIQKFVNNSDNSHYENGYKNGISKLFFTKEKLLQYLSKQNTYVCESDSYFLEKIDIHTDTKLQSFLTTIGKKDEKVDHEFIFYKINPEYLAEENVDENTFIHKLHDENFYETFDYKSKTCEVGLSQEHILRIVCKKVYEESDIYFSETEQYEPEDRCIPKSVENIYNKELTTVQFIFRKENEMEDLIYYWNLYDKQMDLKFPIYVLNDKDNNKSVEVHILELAFYILKQSLMDEFAYRDLTIINKFKNSDIQMNTFFKNYTWNDALIECCTLEEQQLIKDLNINCD